MAMEVGFEKFQRIVVLWVPDIVYTFIELTVKAAFKFKPSRESKW